MPGGLRTLPARDLTAAVVELLVSDRTRHGESTGQAHAAVEEWMASVTREEQRDPGRVRRHGGAVAKTARPSPEVVAARRAAERERIEALYRSRQGGADGGA